MIYNENFIILEKNLPAWEAVSNRLAPSIEIKGIVKNNENKEVRLTIILTEIGSPKNLANSIVGSEMVESNFADTSSQQGFMRSYSFLQTHYFFRNCWVLVGEIKNTKKENVPIVIVYFETGNIASYSIKKETETTEDFLARLN